MVARTGSPGITLKMIKTRVTKMRIIGIVKEMRVIM